VNESSDIDIMACGASTTSQQPKRDQKNTVFCRYSDNKKREDDRQLKLFRPVRFTIERGKRIRVIVIAESKTAFKRTRGTVDCRRKTKGVYKNHSFKILDTLKKKKKDVATAGCVQRKKE